jgi:hypothetical protein
MLLSLKAGGVGINLTAASHAFLLDPWWNPAVEEQAIMRIHRIGQLKNVFVRRFICKVRFSSPFFTPRCYSLALSLLAMFTISQPLFQIL